MSALRADRLGSPDEGPHGGADRGCAARGRRAGRARARVRRSARVQGARGGVHGRPGSPIVSTMTGGSTSVTSATCRTQPNGANRDDAEEHHGPDAKDQGTPAFAAIGSGRRAARRAGPGSRFHRSRVSRSATAAVAPSAATATRRTRTATSARPTTSRRSTPRSASTTSRPATASRRSPSTRS